MFFLCVIFNHSTIKIMWMENIKIQRALNIRLIIYDFLLNMNAHIMLNGAMSCIWAIYCEKNSSQAKRSWPIQIHRNCYYRKCSKWEWKTRTRTWFVTSGHKTNFFPKISIFDFDKVKWLSVEYVFVLVLTSLFIGSIMVLHWFKWHKRSKNISLQILMD